VSEASSGSVAGVVTASATGEPVAGAEVRLAGGPLKQTRHARTDDHGRYELSGVEEGRYTLRASKAGYLSMAYGQRLPSEAAADVQVAQAQAVEGIDIALFRSSVIVVRVVDPYGDPVPGIDVRAFERRFFTDGEKLVRAGGNLISYSTTDDRGEIRLYDLAPGAYYIAARRGRIAGLLEGRLNAEQDVHYPGTLFAAEAQPVAVREGEEIAIALPFLAAGRSTLAGMLIDSAGVPIGEANVQMVRSRLGGSSSHGVTLAPDGSLGASDLFPGEYIIQVRTGPRPAGEEYALVTVRVLEGVDTTNLVVQTRPAATIRGRVLFDDVVTEGRPSPASLSVVPAFTAGSSWASGRSTTQNDWSFAITNLLGSGVLRVKGPAGWFLDRVLLGTRDISDLPLDFHELAAAPVEIHLTTRQSRLAGTAVDAQGRPTVSYVVVAFADDRRLWTPHSRSVAAARPDQTGRFTLSGLPPGRYHVVALNYLEAGTERDPRVLERLAPHAIPLTLGEGETRAMDLTIVERH
jgi:protocatechuate 3,4-dioxygenase beta subunit